MTVQMMTYPDGEIAKIEEQKYQNQDKPSRMGPNLWSMPVRAPGYREIVRKYNFLILIHSPRGDRREVVQRLAAGRRDA